MNPETKIINHLKKEVYDIIFREEGKSLENRGWKCIRLWYSIKDSVVNGTKKGQNHFYYDDEADKINELIKKDPMEIFEFLAEKHLEKNQGYGKTPKQFKTPCYLCNQKTLTTLGWSEEGYPDDLERFFCRLCKTSFGWIDIKDDPLELQLEMRKYYLAFKEKDLEGDEKTIQEMKEKFDKIKARCEKNLQFVIESKEFIAKHKRK